MEYNVWHKGIVIGYVTGRTEDEAYANAVKIYGPHVAVSRV